MVGGATEDGPLIRPVDSGESASRLLPDLAIFPFSSLFLRVVYPHPRMVANEHILGPVRPWNWVTLVPRVLEIGARSGLSWRFYRSTADSCYRVYGHPDQGVPVVP